MINNRRMTRINDEVRREVAEIIRSELNDPRVSVMASVIKVNVTPDFKYCKIYVSVLGTESQREDVMDGIRNAGGFIRKLLAERVNLRQTPELTFISDDSIEHGIKISKLIDEISSGSSDSLRTKD